MSMITIKCPNTGLEIPTGIDTDSLSFSRLPDVPARTWCPACGYSHVWWKPAAHLESVAPMPARSPRAEANS